MSSHKPYNEQETILTEMTSVRENYCLDCDWSASRENYDQQELTRLAIEHAVEYGHDIDSISN